MADNVTVDSGTGITVATDDIGGVAYQRVKLSQGADGSATDVSSAAPLQVSLANHAANATAVKVDGSAATQPVSGTVSVSGTVTVGSHAVTVASGGVASGGVASGAIASGAYASGSMSNVYAYNTGAASATSVRVCLADVGVGEYETVAASATAQVLGATGGTGDYIAGVLIIPATTSPGNVLLLDNATSITIFAGGASSVSNLVPFYVPLGIYSVSGAWKITTGSNVSCIGMGNFA